MFLSPSTKKNRSVSIHERNIQLLQLKCIIIIIIYNFFFVNIIHHFKILQKVFRPKKLIKANCKPSKLKVLKDIFQQSFKFHNWVKKNAYISACTHKRTYAYSHMHAYIQPHIYTQTYPYTHSWRKSTTTKTKGIILK